MEKGSEVHIPSNNILSTNYINNNNGDSCSKVITPSVSPVTSSVDRINKSFKDLNIDCSTTKMESDGLKDDKYLAGSIQRIISTMGLVLIQPLLPNLLYLDSPLFLCDSNSQDKKHENYIYLGKIDDIFGSISEPMYTVYPTLETMNILNIGDEVYFLPNNPDTKFMSLKCTSNNTFSIIKI